MLLLSDICLDPCSLQVYQSSDPCSPQVYLKFEFLGNLCLWLDCHSMLRHKDKCTYACLESYLTLHGWVQLLSLSNWLSVHSWVPGVGKWGEAWPSSCTFCSYNPGACVVYACEGHWLNFCATDIWLDHVESFCNVQNCWWPGRCFPTHVQFLEAEWESRYSDLYSCPTIAILHLNLLYLLFILPSRLQNMR